APGFESTLSRYGTAVQDLRMVASMPAPHVVWTNATRRWSQAALAQDGDGRILLVHSRAPHFPGDLARGLLALPLDIRVLMHTEGGPEASLAVRSRAASGLWFGMRETAPEAAEAAGAPLVPNVFAGFPRARSRGFASAPGSFFHRRAMLRRQLPRGTDRPGLRRRGRIAASRSRTSHRDEKLVPRGQKKRTRLRQPPSASEPPLWPRADYSF